LRMTPLLGSGAAASHVLQWGRSPRAADDASPSPATPPPASRFNGAAARGLRMTTVIAAFGLDRPHRFNGAAARGLRMTPQRPSVRAQGINASMGPQPAGCG